MIVKLKKTKNRNEWTAKVQEDIIVFNSKNIGAGGCTPISPDNRVWKIIKKKGSLVTLEESKTISLSDYSFANDEKNWQ